MFGAIDFPIEAIDARAECVGSLDPDPESAGVSGVAESRGVISKLPLCVEPPEGT
jgi:hypothetical protein